MRPLLLALVLLAGCGTLHVDYVAADIKKYRAVVPDLIAHYDEVEDVDERALRMNTITTWTIRIQEALRAPECEDLEFTPIEVPSVSVELSSE